MKDVTVFKEKLQCRVGSETVVDRDNSNSTEMYQL